MRLYRYVGPNEIRARAQAGDIGTPIASVRDLRDWLAASQRRASFQDRPIFTFVIDETGTLRVADRSSEHVSCAGGRPVQSAGEFVLAHTSDGWHIEEISNQSTGY